MNSLNIIKYTFSLVGLGMLVWAVFLYKSTNDFLAKAETTEGTVIELVRSRSSDSDTYHPIVAFVDKAGKYIQFESSAGSNPPSYDEGERVKVFYLEDEPQKAKINGYFSLWGGVTILSGMGLVFFLIGFSIIAFGFSRENRRKYLLKNGKVIDTKFISVEINSSLSVNGRSPFLIVTQWQNPETHKVHLFKSDNIWFDPSEYISSEIIKVYIDPTNLKKYYVDISFLPEIVE